MRDAIRFIRKNGKVIPITAGGVARVAGAASTAKNIHKQIRTAPHLSTSAVSGAKGFKTNHALEALGTTLAVASGAVAAATNFSAGRVALAGIVGSEALDLAATSVAYKSASGGTKKDRLKHFAQQEAKNAVVGNAVWIGGLLGSSKGRRNMAAFGIKTTRKAKRFFT